MKNLMKTTSHHSSLTSTLGAVTLAAVLAGCGGGTGSTGTTLSQGAVTVAVSGSAMQGQTLTAVKTITIDDSGSSTTTYQWRADGAIIANATASTLALSEQQVGKVISVALVYSDGKGGQANVSSAVTDKVMFATSNLQGIWTVAATANSDAAAMVVFPTGDTWTVVSHSSQVQLFKSLYKGTATGYSGTGKEYIAGTTTINSSVDFTASATAKSTLSATITPSGEAARVFNFAYDTRYDAPAKLSDIASTWKSSGAVVLTWTIGTDGILTGNSTTGCTYSGAVAVHAAGTTPVGVFDLTLHEACGSSATVDYAGIVTLNASKTSANFAFINSAGTTGNFIAMGKPTT